MSIQFDKQAWLNFATGKADSYRFANPENSSDPRSNYRLGLMNSAKGIISIFDAKENGGNNDGKTSFDEYCREQNYYLKNNPYISHDYNTDAITGTFKSEFNAMDINNDGYLDYKERANELRLLDANKSANQEDGSIDHTGADNVYYNRSFPELMQAFEKSYYTMNMDKLGEKGDIKTASQAQDTSKPVIDNDILKNLMASILSMMQAMNALLVNFANRNA